MAIPERRDPNVPRADADGLDTRGRRVRAGGGWGWWWIWIIIICLVIWWAGWGWGTSGGYWRGRRNETQNPAPNAAANNNGAINSAAPNAGANTGTGYGSANTPPPNATAGSTAPGNTISGPGVEMLNAANKQQYVGQPFQASNVPVQKVVNKRAVWIGTGNGKRMLAVVQNQRNNTQNVSTSNIAAGKLVDVSGTVEKAPSKQRAEHDFGLSADGASRLEHDGAYIQLSQLTPPPQQP